MNILIVDDTKFDIMIAKEIIESSGIECFITTAGSGEEAIEIINSEEIDIVLLNIVMANLSGIETLEIIRRKNKNIIILMVTSLMDKKYLEKSFELGANDYINLPIEPIEFISRLKAAIKMKKCQNALLESYDNLKNDNYKLKESNMILSKTQIDLINEEKHIIEGINKIILDVIPNLMFYKDINGKYLWCNNAYEKALGMKRKDIIGKTDYEITSKEIADLFSKFDLSIIKTKKTSFYESEILHADGLMHYTIVSRTPYLNEENEVLGILGIVSDITEQKRIEKELKSTQLKMEVLLDSGPQFILILNSEFKVQAFNNNAAKMAKDLYGLSLKEGDYISKFLRNDLYEKFKDNFNKSLNGYEVKSEKNLKDSKGHEIWIEIYYSPISYETQDEKMVCITCIPITDRKIAEKNLYEKLWVEEKYRELFDNVNSCIFVNKFLESSMVGEFIEVNKLACEKLGYTKDEFKDLSFFDLLENKSTYIEKLNKAIVEDNWMIETNIKDKSGSIIPFEISIHVFNLQDEKVILSFAHDISKRKEANEKIKKLSLAIENSPSSVVITDIAGKIEYVNPKFSELTGYSSEEIKGKNISILKSGYHEKEYYKELWSNIISGNEWRGEFYNKRKDGSKYWEYTSVAPLKNEEGNLAHFISVREDITKRKGMEEELRQSNEELKDTIKKLKITQSQLIQQEKLAGIGQLAAGVAHEINNPLGFISSNFDTLKNYTEKLKDSIFDYRELIEKIKIKDINLIESELKQFKQLNEKKEIEYIITDLDDLFNESEEGIERVISIVKGLKWFAHEDQSSEFGMYDLNLGIKNTLIVTKNEIKYIADVIEEYDGELPLIKASGQKINQVLLNIIINSVYAIKEKERDEFGVITIKTYKDNEFVFCEIKDNGTGIKEDIINKLFEPFFTTKPIGKGTGLGLNIAYDIIVNVHKGNIECKNNEEGGACFIIKLPIEQNVN